MLLRKDSLSKTARILFFLGVTVWIGFGIFSLVRLGNRVGTQYYVMLAMIVLMFGNAAILSWFGWMAGQEPPRYLRLALFYIFLNIVLSVTDQFGLIDLLYLFFCLILFVTCLRLYLLVDRRI